MENIKNLAKALVQAQSEMSNAKKDATNPFFKSKYADLNAIREAVLPILNSHGISVLQPMTNIEGKNFIKTILLHETGESIESFTEIIYSKVNDAQAQGSGITYARRYGLQSFVCVGAEDDDGNKAVKPAEKWLTENSPEWEKLVEAVEAGKEITLESIKKKYKVRPETIKTLETLNIF